MRGRLSALVVVIFLFLGSLSIVVAGESIRLTSGDWPPYTSELLKRNGIASYIVKQAFALQGVNVEFGFFAWRRALTLARAGWWHGSSVWSWSKERDENFYYSEPVLEPKDYFFYLKSRDFDWDSFDDLGNETIGISEGYYYGIPFEEAKKAGKFRTEVGSSDTVNLKKLLDGRISLFVCDLNVGLAVLSRDLLPAERKRITYHPKHTSLMSYHLVLSKKIPGNKALMEKFNNGLAELKQSGAYDQAFEDYRGGKY
ncbi:substrate-binding periplasmic protein [Sedimenticola sp.]|uniref:substrate-binding periplasmic protein n=1 Tax=Sedimenticola sp. TaxID=1940285 RepID=UPI003D10362C